MEEKFLPIGSVCRLKGATRYLMVTGFCVKKEEENEMYDYLGCVYPQGVVSTDVNFLFNHDQIEELAFKGFVNDAEKAFKEKLLEVVNNEEPTIKNTDILKSSSEPISPVETPVEQPVAQQPFAGPSVQQTMQQPNTQMFTTLNLNSQDNN